MLETDAKLKWCPMTMNSEIIIHCSGLKCMAWIEQIVELHKEPKGECGMIPPREINVNRRGD